MNALFKIWEFFSVYDVMRWHEFITVEISRRFLIPLFMSCGFLKLMHLVGTHARKYLHTAMFVGGLMTHKPCDPLRK